MHSCRSGYRTCVLTPVLGCLLVVTMTLAIGLAVHHVAPRGSPTFASETAHLDAPPPSRPGHLVRVSSEAAFERSVERARAGETIVVAGRVLIPGEFTGFDRIVRGGTVGVVLGPHVTFDGGGAEALPAVFLSRAGGWRVWGGRVVNPTGGGILVYATAGPFTWTGFHVTRTAGSCVSVFPVGGNVDRVVLAGVTGTARPDLALDPHGEKGTGIQAWNIADATGGVVEHSTFAADVVDQATGAAVEIDTGQIGPEVTVYAEARHLGFALPGTGWNGDAQRQVAGNVIQLWGGTPSGTLDLAYVAGGDIAGRLVDTTGVRPGADLSRVTLGYARVTGPILRNPLLSGPAAVGRGGMRLGTVVG